MEDTNPKFEPGMLVAYCETWPTQRVICIDVVKTVGKRDIKLVNNYATERFRPADGRTWKKSPYQWRAIKPLTKKLLAQAEVDKASGIGRALGRQIPEE